MTKSRLFYRASSLLSGLIWRIEGSAAPVIIQQRKYPVFLDGISGYYGLASLLNDKKLPVPMVSFQAAFPGCGYTTTTSYFYLEPDPKIWKLAFRTEDIAEGRSFDNHYQVTFPADKGGNPNQIKIQLIESVWDDRLNDLKVVKTNPPSIYVWNGKAFITK